MDELTIIENKIYEIRGQRVMLDFDLAEPNDLKNKYGATWNVSHQTSCFR